MSVTINGSAGITTNDGSIFTNSSGNMGVGTSSPTARFHSVGASATGADFSGRFQNSAAADLLTIRNDGVINTGLAAASPYNNTTASAANAFISAAGVMQRSTSSIKYKRDVINTEHGLTEVMQLRPVTYKGNNDGDTVFGGLIAEEVDSVGLKEFVQYAEDGTPDAIAYGNMVSLAFKAIQEQQEIINSMKLDIEALKAKF